MPGTVLGAGNIKIKKTTSLTYETYPSGGETYNIHINKPFQYPLLSNEWLQNLVT